MFRIVIIISSITVKKNPQKKQASKQTKTVSNIGKRAKYLQ